MLGFRWTEIETGALRFLRHGWQSWSFTGARALDAAGEPEFPSGPWLRGIHHGVGAPPPDRAGWHESDLVSVVGGIAFRRRLPGRRAGARRRDGARLPEARRGRGAGGGGGSLRGSRRSRGASPRGADPGGARRRAEPPSRGLRRSSSAQRRGRAPGVPSRPAGAAGTTSSTGSRRRICSAIWRGSRRARARSPSTWCSSTTATSAPSATGSRPTSGFPAASPRWRLRSGTPASAPASGRLPSASPWRAAFTRATATGCCETARTCTGVFSIPSGRSRAGSTSSTPRGKRCAPTSRGPSPRWWGWASAT